MDLTTKTAKPNLFGTTRAAFESWLQNAGFPQLHARNLYRCLFKQLRLNPAETSSFPIGLQKRLATEWRLGPLPTALDEQHSQYDYSVKYVLQLADGNSVEAVLMPEKQRITLCLSSQVGCRQACVFCHTGRMGLLRNLEAGEIISQIVHANRWIEAHPEWLLKNRLPIGQRVSNLVFMGMGEPLDNVDAVFDAVQIATDPYGLGLGLRHISVSTAGHLEGLQSLVSRIPGVRIALSVHSTFDAKRSKIMPINKRWPLTDVVDYLRHRPGAARSPVMFQYTMIAGVNDGLDEAHRLVELAHGLNAKINLIPLNNISSSRLAAPSQGTIQAFRDILHAAKLRVMVRYSKGQDIGGACGQLIVDKPELGSGATRTGDYPEERSDATTQL